VLLEHEAARNHRDYPAALEESVYVDHQAGREERAITSHPSVPAAKEGSKSGGNEGPD
jgi:hypothetical protein